MLNKILHINFIVFFLCSISLAEIIKDINKEENFYLESFIGAHKIISKNISDKSILIVMGAGSIGNFAKEFIGLIKIK